MVSCAWEWDSVCAPFTFATRTSHIALEAIDELLFSLHPSAVTSPCHVKRRGALLTPI